MSGSRCPVSARGNCLWGSPPPHASRGKMPRASAVWPPLPSPAHKWWLLLWGVLQACSTQGSVLLAQRLPQKLTSPGYPEPYVKGQESSTDIEAPEGFAVRLIFQDFDLELSPDCEGDSVTVSWVGPRRDCGEGAFQPGEQGQWEAAVALNPEACLGGQITASGMDLSRFCGQQGSPLGSTPGDREFVSLGNSLRLTFRAPASSEDGTPGLHKGFLALYQAVDMNHIQPISQASGGPEAINTHRDNPAKVQSHCQAPYYQAVAAGTLSCTAQVPWKQAQEGEDVLSCVPVCGRPVNPIAQDRETHGASRAEPGNFPWQALTSIYGRGGGALLGDRWVLTAAHTIYPKDGFFLGKSRSASVFLGHTSAAEMLQRGGHPVRRVVVHPDYRQNESHNFHGDIALLELQHGVPLGPSLLPVCLPAREALYRSGRLGYVSGFGVQMGWLTTELKYSRLPVAPREACEAWLRDKRRGEVFSDNMFCAGDEMLQQGVCQGDSGGAFVVWDDRAHHWVATGIVSWGIGCGKGYGFYTKVLNYVDWIKSVMGRKD